VERLLIFIKHNFGFLWKVIEWANDLIFTLLFKSKLQSTIRVVFAELSHHPFLFRRLASADIMPLHKLITSQLDSDIEYFKPHKFDIDSLRTQLKKPSFLMMGAYDGEEMTGYFFLRFFINKKCFVGRLIDKKYRGKGIGPAMNSIMYETAWRMDFRCLSTISRSNSAVMKAHSKNQNMVVLKELQNNYLLVEFVKQSWDLDQAGSTSSLKVSKNKIN
jgi:hypothetical protein